MINNLEGYVSSRQSPAVYFYSRQNYMKSLYGNMLVEDLCHSFSLFLSDYASDRDFYNVEPSTDRLKTLLLFYDWHFFRNGLDKLLNTTMHSLITEGKAFIEIVTWKDCDGNFTGLSFLPLCVRWKKKLCNNTFFLARSIDKKFITFTIQSKNVICFDLKDLNIRRYYFRRLIRRLSRRDITSISSLSIDPRMQGKFDFDEYLRKNEFSLLKCTHKVFWYGRDGSNQHLSESYLLYRAAHYKMWREKILEYFIHQINTALELFKEELGFNGTIAVNSQIPDLDLELQRYYLGQINATQLANLVFKV